MATSEKRRRWPWIVAAVIFVGMLVAALAIPALLQPERYRSRIQAALQSATGWEAELGELDFSIAHGMVLTVSPGALRAPGDSSRFQIETLAIKADLWPLLRGQLDVRRIDLIGPDILLVRDDEAAGWTLPLATGDNETAGSGAADNVPALVVSIDSVQIQGGRLVIDDRVAPGLRFELLDVDAALDLATLTFIGEAALSDDGGRVMWNGPLEEAITLELDGVRTEFIHPFVGSDLLHGGGRLSGAVMVDWPESVRGDLTGTQITLLAGERPFDDSTVAFEISLADGGLHLDRLDFRAQGVQLTGSGPLTPDLSVDLQLPRAPLGATLRAAESVLPLPLDLKPPGAVQATFDVDLPAGGDLSYAARGELEATEFNAGDMLPAAQNIRAAFELNRKGILKVRVREGTVAGGAVTGTAWIDPVFPPGELRFDGGLQDAMLGYLLDSYVTRAAEEISGPTSVAGKVTVKLDGPLDARALGGRVDFNAATVAVPGWDLEGEILSKVQEKLGALADLAGLLGSRLGAELDSKESGDKAPLRTDLLESLSATVNFDAWPWKVEELTLAAGDVSATGEGTFDPIAGSVDLRFSSRLSRELTADLVARNKQLKPLVGPGGQLVLPLHIQGPLLGPSINVDLKKLALESLGAESTKDALKGLFKNLLDKK